MNYDDLDLLELFLSEPVKVYEGLYEYIAKRNNVSLLVWIDIYENTVGLVLQYGDLDLYSGGFCHVTELKKVDMYLKIMQNEKELASIFLGEKIRINTEHIGK